MLILGLDVATNTGAAWYDTDKPENEIIAENLKAVGMEGEGKAWNVSRLLKSRIGHHGVPDLVIVEAALRTPMKNPKTQAQLLMIQGSYLGMLGLYKIPVETVEIGTWRKDMYGFSRGCDNWKKHAKKHCGYVGAKVTNHDQAEAVMLAIWGKRKSQMVTQAKYGEAMGRTA